VTTPSVASDHPGAAPSRPDRRRRLWTWLAWAAVAVFYALVRVPLLDVPLERDEGAFGLVGQAILRGGLPYRDVFDYKPPGVFYLYALALTAVPPTAAGIHAFAHAWNFGTLLFVAALASALAGSRAALWAAWVYAVASAAPSVEGFMAGAELFMLLPMVASVWLMLVGLRVEGVRRAVWLAASGACGAAAFWIKQPAAASLALVPLYLAVHYGGGRLTLALRAFGAWLGGAVAVSLAVCLPFLAAGVFGELVYWAFPRGATYLWWRAEAWSTVLLARVTELGRDHWLLAVLALGATAWAVRTRRRDGWVSPAFLALSFVGASHTPHVYPHYLAQIGPALALAAGSGLATLHDTWLAVRPRALRVAGVAALAVLVVGIPAAARPWYWIAPDPTTVSLSVLGPQAFEAGPLLAGYLRERMAPDAWMFVYGSEPQVPFQAERRSANPYVLIYPLTTDGPRHREFQKRTWATIERVRPEYILIVHTFGTSRQSPGSDPFLQRPLFEPLESAYRIEAYLRYEERHGLRLVPAEPGSSRDQGGRSAVYEIWRRDRRSR